MLVTPPETDYTVCSSVSHVTKEKQIKAVKEGCMPKPIVYTNQIFKIGILKSIVINIEVITQLLTQVLARGNHLSKGVLRSKIKFYHVT